MIIHCTGGILILGDILIYILIIAILFITGFLLLKLSFILEFSRPLTMGGLEDMRFNSQISFFSLIKFLFFGLIIIGFVIAFLVLGLREASMIGLINNSSFQDVTLNQLKHDIDKPATKFVFNDENFLASSGLISELSITGYENQNDDLPFRRLTDYRTYYFSLQFEYMNNNYEVAECEASGSLSYFYLRDITSFARRYQPGWNVRSEPVLLKGPDSIYEALSSVSANIRYSGSTISMNLNKSVYATGEHLEFILLDIPDNMFDENAWIAIYDYGASHADWHNINLGGSRSGNTAYGTFKLPIEPGIYEIRLYSVEEANESTFLVKLPFLVVEPVETQQTRRIICSDEGLVENINSSIEIRHRIRRDVISGSVYNPPIINLEKCVLCGLIFSDQNTDWSFVWVTPIILVGIIVFVITGLKYHQRITFESGNTVSKKLITKKIIIPFVSLLLPVTSILIINIALHTEPELIYSDISGFIFLWIISFSILIPFSIIFFASKNNYKKKRIIGLLLALAITFSLTLGGIYLNNRDISDQDDIRISIGLIISGALYGPGCIMAFIFSVPKRTGDVISSQN